MSISTNVRMNPLATTFFELFADNLPRRSDKVFLIDP